MLDVAVSFTLFGFKKISFDSLTVYCISIYVYLFIELPAKNWVQRFAL